MSWSPRDSQGSSRGDCVPHRSGDNHKVSVWTSGWRAKVLRIECQVSSCHHGRLCVCVPGTMAAFTEVAAKAFLPHLPLFLVSFMKVSLFHSRQCRKGSWRDFWNTESPFCRSHSCQHGTATDFELSEPRNQVLLMLVQGHLPRRLNKTADSFSTTYSLLNHTDLPSCDSSLWC